MLSAQHTITIKYERNEAAFTPEDQWEPIEFVLEVEGHPLHDSCAYIYRDKNGTLTSRNSPIASHQTAAEYKPNTACSYALLPPPGHYITLHFAEVDIFESPDCAQDRLTVC